MKLKAFFEKLEADGKISNDKFKAAVQAIPDFELDDEAVSAFENSFMTVDRAKVHREVQGAIMPVVLGPIEKDLKKIMGIIDGVDKFKSSEIDKMDSTYKRIEAITAYLPEMVSKLKVPSTDEETKKELEKAKGTITELTGKFEKLNGETADKEKFWQKESEKAIKGFKLDMLLENKAQQLTFGKAYADPLVRKDITKVNLNALKESNLLELIEQDGAEPSIQILDKDGKPRFNGNTPVTIDNLMEQTFQRYIKKSNDDQDDQGAQTTKHTVPDGQQTTIRRGARTTVQ